jgi:hypothetical protein
MASAYNITPDKFKAKWKILLFYRKDMGKDITLSANSLVSMFGYIDNNKEKIHKMVKDVLSPALGRPVDELQDLLLFGSIDECTKKIKAFLEAGVNSIHFWPVNNYIEQIDIFSKEIICAFKQALISYTWNYEQRIHLRAHLLKKDEQEEDKPHLHSSSNLQHHHHNSKQSIIQIL